MKKKYLLIIFIFPLLVFSQKNDYSIKEIKQKTNWFFSHLKDDLLTFPIIEGNNISPLINLKLKEDFEEYFDVSGCEDIESMLRRASNSGLSGLTYTIFDNDTTISIKLSYLLSIGKTYSFWDKFYTFNKKSGELIRIKSLLKNQYNNFSDYVSASIRKYSFNKIKSLKNNSYFSKLNLTYQNEIQEKLKHFSGYNIMISKDFVYVFVNNRLPYDALCYEISPIKIPIHQIQKITNNIKYKQ